jgi:hypothetical protein
MKVWVRATRGQLSAHGSVTMLTRVEFEISVVVEAKEPYRAYVYKFFLTLLKKFNLYGSSYILTAVTMQAAVHVHI